MNAPPAVNSPIRMLILEDEKNLGSTLKEQFELDGFEVTWAKSLLEGDAHLKKTEPDLAIVDVGLPDGSGFEFARRMRKQTPRTALVFLTALGDPENRILGLELGAEDYITKPFHLKELKLRVRNALQRTKLISSNLEVEPITLGKTKIDFLSFEAKQGDQTISLTHKECALLKILYLKRGEVVSRDEILDRVWGEGEFPSPRTIDNFILRLRKIIEENPEKPEIIRSVRGVGYMLK